MSANMWWHYTPTLRHQAVIGQSPQWGVLGVQVSRPREIMFTCNEYRSAGGILDCSRSMSRGAQCLSFCVGLTQPRRLATRQQCVSTGKTCLPSEYISTHRATFLPTPGSDNKKASASSSLISRNGFRVGSPNSATITSRSPRIALAFWFDSPPLTMGRAIYSAGASAMRRWVGKASFSERKLLR